MLRKIVFLWTISFFVISCGLFNNPQVEEGELQLSFDAWISAKTRVNPDDAKGLIVTIEDSLGNVVHETLYLPLLNMNGYFITAPIHLKVGSYSLTKFLVADDAGDIIYACPVEGTELANSVYDPLAIEFEIVKDVVLKLVPEVISTEGCIPNDFGYLSFSFEVVDVFEFLIAVTVFNEAILNFELTDALLTIKGDGELIYQWPLEAITNMVTVRDGYDEYELTVSKDGYAPWVETYTNAQLNVDCDDCEPITVVLLNISKTYTIDVDFDEGDLVGVEHDTVHDQLQLSEENIVLPFIWVPNNQGTVSKVNTETGKELARYWTYNGDGSPSRTTIDLAGNCWVGNRNVGTVVKIGLYETGNWIDRNGDGICQTSLDLNDDGNITGAELLPFGTDECVLFEVVLNDGSENVYVPGTVPPWQYNGSGPRGLAIDSNNNLWAGTYNTRKYYYIDGASGTIMKKINTPNHSAYGAVVDGNGMLWSASRDWMQVMRLNPADDSMIATNLPDVYGIGLDYTGKVFVAGWSSMNLYRFDAAAGTLDWTKTKNPQLRESRGVACTSDNDVWVVSSTNNAVYRYSNDGDTLKATIPIGSHPTGVSVDAAGKVWACDYGDESIHRINPATNSVDLVKPLIGSNGHYSYSDMTGIVARTITTQLGTWTVVYDSEAVARSWSRVSWTEYRPAGTTVKVRVRSSEDGISYSAWETALNGVNLTTIPAGRYIAIEVTLQILSGDISPILYDLTVY